jgi:hypothetical protein
MPCLAWSLRHVKGAKGVLMKARALNEGAARPSIYVFPKAVTGKLVRYIVR